MPTYLFLRVYASSDALLLPICFHWSVTVWSLNRAEVCFSILESFNNCIEVKLVFSLYDPLGWNILASCDWFRAVYGRLKEGVESFPMMLRPHESDAWMPSYCVSKFRQKNMDYSAGRN
ncbi:hypothetical protein RclHR1_25830001 [Rhizophagus clarus]|uniref:Uncharacterized protein n=1 Tax=Rhizophagus clarus TaxID=94130 RepID=A0A2Z6RUI8_9GLOM|nr:hypothetical protein RclHR1_25830001 [Rhizophagus clarus]